MEDSTYSYVLERKTKHLIPRLIDHIEKYHQVFNKNAFKYDNNNNVIEHIYYRKYLSYENYESYKMDSEGKDVISL